MSSAVAYWSGIGGAILALPLVLTGCASSTVVDPVKQVTICLNGQCGPAEERMTREQLISSLLMMYKGNENNEVVLCDTKPDSRECARNFITFFVQGGPVPGVSTFGSPLVSNVGLDKATLQIKYASSAFVTWMGTPVLCQNQYTEITVDSPNAILIESPSFACTWTVLPHIWSNKFAVDFIDFDNSVIGGNYAIRGAGLMVAGGGSGNFAIRMPKTRTLAGLNQGDKAEPVSLTQLPTKVLAAPVPTLDEVKQAKTEDARDPEELKRWEAASAENTAAAYQRYLDAYPQGRFVSNAKANLAVVREQEARDRELDRWTRIKDSANVADFKSYLSDYPKGLFTDLASVKAQRLEAAAAEKSAIDAELTLWERVRNSNDPAELETYRKRYPGGQFVQLAQSRIDKLKSAANQQQDLEMLMWGQIKNSNKPEDYRRYLQAFPNGVFAELASGRIGSLSSAAEQSAEMQLWEEVRNSSLASDFEVYLKRYPEGRFSPLARQLVSQLKSVAVEQAELTLWNGIQNSKRAQDFAAYLEKYPQGRFAELARSRRQDMEQEASFKNIDFGRYFALVIGINSYPKLTRLETAINDARSVAKALEGDYGFSVATLIDADRKSIIEALSQYRHSLGERDNLLIYYAGHGFLDEESSRGYWLPTDADRNSPANWISTADITDSLKAMKAKHVMVVADSCYSGTLARDAKIILPSPDYLTRIATKRARVALTSGGLEPVLDSGGGGHSVFAAAFLSVLKENRAVIEGTRLFSELRRPVVSGAPQTPEYADIRFAGHEGGDFLFVRRK